MPEPIGMCALCGGTFLQGETRIVRSEIGPLEACYRCCPVDPPKRRVSHRVRPETASTSASAAAEPVTFESIQKVVRQFTDRRPATITEIRVHPDYYPRFLNDLRRAGIEPSTGHSYFWDVPVFQDESVPVGVRRCCYAGGGFEDI